MADADVIARARRGDSAAYESLVSEHREAVFRLAYLLLGDADDAEDIAQETFIRAVRALDRFDDARPLRPWLLRITTNLVHNRRRSAGRYWAALRRLMWQTPPDPTVEALSAQQSEARALWQAVRQLSPIDQEVIYLRYFLDLSIEETAAALNVEIGTVKSRTHRALNRLRAVVEQDFPLLTEEGAS